MEFLFDKLEMYWKAVESTGQVIHLTESLPKGMYCLSGQLNRAALSILLNIADATEDSIVKTNRIFFSLARGFIFKRFVLTDMYYC